MKGEILDIYTLNNGAAVLAKPHKGQLQPIRYANYSQAKRKADSIGGDVIQPRLGPVFYVTPPKPRAEPVPDSVEQCEFGDEEYQWRLWQAGL